MLWPPELKFLYFTMVRLEILLFLSRIAAAGVYFLMMDIEIILSHPSDVNLFTGIFRRHYFVKMSISSFSSSTVRITSYLLGRSSEHRPSSPSSYVIDF